MHSPEDYDGGFLRNASSIHVLCCWQDLHIKLSAAYPGIFVNAVIPLEYTDSMLWSPWADHLPLKSWSLYDCVKSIEPQTRVHVLLAFFVIQVVYFLLHYMKQAESFWIIAIPDVYGHFIVGVSCHICNELRYAIWDFQ